MEKRDLKADLELCNRATEGPWEFHEVEFQCGRDECPYEKKREDNSCLKCDGVEIHQSAFVPEVLTLGCGDYDGMNDADAEFIAQSREGWPHAIERAIKAESLARELVVDLEEIKKRGNWLKRDCTEPDKVTIYATNINLIGSRTLTKAKEVLGDG